MRDLKPCLDCPERHVLCHADCEKYKALCEEKKKEREYQKAFRESGQFLYEAKLKQVKRYRRRK